MTMREADRLKTVQAVVDRMLRVGQAALRLGLSRRQMERLVERYTADGVAGLVSRKRGRPSNHQLDPGTAERATALIRERYPDFGPTLACEKLRECHGLILAKETVRVLMMAAGLWTPRRQRAPKIHQPRNRRDCLGELIQIDGSDHAWFEERSPACTLLVFIDDATSRLMQLRFVPTESSFAYFEATRGYLEAHGKPVAFYSDKASIFRPVTKPEFGERGVTQFGRALYELNIDIMCANSSQAKGRVERANQTLQDRLVKELRLRGISTLEAGNAFAGHFMADFNGRFAKSPRRDFNAHRPLRADEDLDLTFTWRELRKVSLSLTLNYAREIYMLADTAGNRRLIQRYIDVYEYPDGRIEVRAGGGALPYVRYDKLPQIDTAAVVENKRLGHALRAAQAIQAQRDDRRCTPSRTNQGQPPRPRAAVPGTRNPRQFNVQDFEQALRKACKSMTPLSTASTTATRPSKAR
ncbi:ISNCY family transposase [Variovorax sp. LjRoot290]